LDRAVELLLLAPLGLVLGLDEVVPELVERGRRQVDAARVFGQFAVEKGQARANRALDRVQCGGGVAGQVVEQLSSLTGRSSRSRSDRREKSASPKTKDAKAAGTATAAGAGTKAIDGSKAVRHGGTAGSGPQVASLAIPDYDSLSASQVVPRLDGLSTAELGAVRDYETTHRGRKTILNKIDQLQA
jgi:hypothetical protein